MNDESEKQAIIEWRAWGTVIVRLREQKIDVSNPAIVPLINAIKRWGEELAFLRVLEPQYCQEALSWAQSESPELAELDDKSQFWIIKLGQS